MVTFGSPEYLDDQQKSKWIEKYENFSKKFKIGEGFWRTGIATETYCNYHKSFVRLFKKAKKKNLSLH